MEQNSGLKVHTPLTAKFLYILASGFSKQNYLGQPLIPFLFRVVTKKYRRSLSLRLLGISPHYFIYQYSTKYPPTMSRIEILEAEYQRNVSSRKKICVQILQQYLSPQMTVLDFGCGPGYLAQEAAKFCNKVIAVDISCGVIACARELNSLDNISYYTNDGKSLSMLDDSSIDLIYSFAVVQHLSEELFEGFLREFFRVLKPRGKVVCHVVLGNNYPTELEGGKGLFFSKFLRKKFGLLMVLRSTKDLNQKIINTGFKEPTFIPVKQISDIEDTIVKQHLFVFSKP